LYPSLVPSPFVSSPDFCHIHTMQSGVKLADRGKNLKAKLVVQAKKFKPTLVLSKLREEGPAGARRLVWFLWIIFLYYQGWSIFAIVRLVVGFAAFLFIGLPFVFKYTPAIQRNLVFLPFVRWPKNVNFSNPEGEGLPGTRNLYIDTDPGVKVGVWHVLPQSQVEESKGKDDDWYEDQLQGDGVSIVLYLHGNTAHRAGAHRMELYKVLRGQNDPSDNSPLLNYHVVTMDYRGYADSTQVAPNETGVVNDAKTVYLWLMSKLGNNSRVIVWGHSLGTAVSSHLVADLCVEGRRPCGLVLESPFNNIFDEVRNHPMAWAWRKMPWFDWFFTTALASNDLGFVSDQRILLIDVPVLILHAEDDAVVPHKLGKALHDTALNARDKTWPQVEFISFDAECGYAHKFIYKDKGLPTIVRNFEARCIRDEDI